MTGSAPNSLDRSDPSSLPPAAEQGLEAPIQTIAPESVAAGCGELQRSLRLTFGPRQEILPGAEVARGGMGAVLQARESATHRTVALKVMLRNDDERSTLRFVEEAQITAQLEHPNIVPVHELSLDEQGRPFYTMKFVAGTTLKVVLDALRKRDAAVVARNRLETLLTAFQKVCDAVAFAHSRGVIHRDLKPANIMLGRFGEVLVMDWGLAKVFSTASARTADSVPAEPTDRDVIRSLRNVDPDATAGTDANVFSTMSGTVMGTAHYMSPEQARGEVERLDQRSDIFALGSILFEIVTLQRPFPGKSAGDVMQKIMDGEFTAPARVLAKVPRESFPLHLPKGEFSASLDAIICKAMAHEPRDRYRTVQEMQADLTAYQNGFATRAEQSSAWRQIRLLIRRNRAIAIAIAASLAVIVALSITFAIKIVGERNRAERALTDLRQTAPTFLAQAQSMLEQRAFEEALGKIDFAIAIDPSARDYRVRRANLLQAMLRLPEAREEYLRVLAAGADAAAERNLRLTEQAIASMGSDGQPSQQAVQTLYEALREQRRDLEAVPLGMRLGLGAAAARTAAEAALAELKRLPEWNRIPGYLAGDGKHRINREADGTLSIHLNHLPVQDLAPLRKLRGLPISSLDITGTLVSDLTPCAGLPLRTFVAEDTAVEDLTPLRGMQLRKLRISRGKISSLEPLRGMPLEELIIVRCPGITSLEPLKGMPLAKLDISWSKVRDLSPLAGMPLHHLSINDVGDLDLTALRGLKLKTFSATGSKIQTLAGLEGMPLERVVMHNASIRDISALKDSPVQFANFNQSPVRDFSVLATCPKLNELSCWMNAPGLEALRGRPGIYYEVGTYDAGWLRFPAEKFWPIRDKLADLNLLRRVEGTRWGVLLRDPTPANVPVLRDAPIDALTINDWNFKDLAPLAGMNLRMIACDKTGVQDVAVLATMPRLEAAMVPRSAANIEALRKHPTLKYLGVAGDWDSGAMRSRLPVAEFWARYDAEKASGGAKPK